MTKTNRDTRELFPDPFLAAASQAAAGQPPALTVAMRLALSKLPSQAQTDPGWQPMLLIILGVPRLRQTITPYLNLKQAWVDVPGYQAEMRGLLSYSEKWLAALAFHLFNNTHPLPKEGLAGLRYLDRNNFELVLTALRLAHTPVTIQK